MDIRFNQIKKIEAKAPLDLNNSILILGKASNNNLTGEIIRAKDYDDVLKAYGDSELTRAAQYVLSSGVQEVYLYNCYEVEHYISIVNKLHHYEFNFIIPIGLSISDKFYNKSISQEMTYAEFYLDNLPEETKSVIIMTDKHADLYEDMDHYMFSTEDLLYEVKDNAIEPTNEKWTNLIFVCNMLGHVEYSSVVLATQLSLGQIGHYPEDIMHGTSYDYDSFDILNRDICYFKNNLLDRKTSIENLVNMRVSEDPYKSVLVDLVLKYIKRNLNLDKYKGSRFNSYIKIQIANDIKAFMNPLVGNNIKNYLIKSINFVLTGPNVGNVLIEMEVTPRGTFESLLVNLEV